MTTAITKSTNESANKGTGLTPADKAKAGAKAKPAASNVGRIKPWVDLQADAARIAEGPAPREKTVLHCMLTLLKERGAQGATLDEIKASFKAINMEHHDPKALCIWASKNRGYGFHMKKDGHVVLRLKAE